jgi:mannose-1-phosphate guanylyltransferase
MFCFQAGAMLQQMREHCPDILDAVQLSLQAAQTDTEKTFTQISLDPDHFAKVREDSIDYAVFEKTNAAAMVPCNIGWSDIGSWAALSMLTPPNDNDNRIYGDVQLHDVQNCFIHSPDRLIGAVGIKNLVIVDTPDALLIADKNRTQEVKHIYTQLKNANHQAHKLHRTVARPWGTYTVLEEGENFKIKRITVKPKSSLSLQMHHHRSEHWVVIHGEANIVNGDRTLTIKHNESTFIPAGSKHRLANQTNEELVIIEVQTGSYVGEDDIVRFEDVYGRC